MELPPLTPSRSPRPLARPSPRKLDSPLKGELLNENDIEVLNKQKLVFVQEDEPLEIEINDPLMYEEDLRWPSEDRIGTSEVRDSFEPSAPGFRVYKAAQAKLLQVVQ